jgi:hypothetical protein|tara:strand:+ start:3186 stop:3341 length:156 start_codon:yes stop_codon:yes gene_type:complete
MKYVVCWTDSGLYKPENCKVIESKETADYLVKHMKKLYNHVRVYKADKYGS